MTIYILFIFYLAIEVASPFDIDLVAKGLTPLSAKYSSAYLVTSQVFFAILFPVFKKGQTSHPIS